MWGDIDFIQETLGCLLNTCLIVVRTNDGSFLSSQNLAASLRAQVLPQAERKTQIPHHGGHGGLAGLPGAHCRALVFTSFERLRANGELWGVDSSPAGFKAYLTLEIHDQFNINSELLKFEDKLAKGNVKSSRGWFSSFCSHQEALRWLPCGRSQQ